MAAITALALWDLAAMRRPVCSARRVGMAQIAAGLVTVAVTAAAVLVSA